MKAAAAVCTMDLPAGPNVCRQCSPRSDVGLLLASCFAGWSPMRHAVTVNGGINTKEGTRSWQV